MTNRASEGNSFFPWRKRLVSLVCLAASLFSGCGKDENENYIEEESTTINAALGQHEAYDALEVAYEAEVGFKRSRQRYRFKDGSYLLDSIGHCFRFTNNETAHTLTLDFGGIGQCTGSVFPLNRIRSGRMIITYTALGDTAGNRTITFDSYVVNAKKISGTVALQNIVAVNGQLQGTCTFTDFMVAFPDGTSATFNGNQTRLWVFGAGDRDPANNIYRITGDLSGTSQSGRAFTAEITQPVFSNFTCVAFPRDSGRVELSTLSGYPVRTRTVNYRTGCVLPRLITVTTYLRTHTIEVTFY
jgi:hypothetical protein